MISQSCRSRWASAPPQTSPGLPTHSNRCGQSNDGSEQYGQQRPGFISCATGSSARRCVNSAQSEATYPCLDMRDLVSVGVEKQRANPLPEIPDSGPTFTRSTGAHGPCGRHVPTHSQTSIRQHSRTRILLGPATSHLLAHAQRAIERIGSDTLTFGCITSLSDRSTVDGD